VDGFFWLAGQGGYGVQTSPALAGLARDLIFGGDTSLPSEIKAAVSPMRYSS
jgi:D-arginine dehydrogenase